MKVKHPYLDMECLLANDPTYGKVAITHDRFGKTLLLKASKLTRLIAKECAGCGRILPRKMFKNGGKKENFYLCLDYFTFCFLILPFYF
jgi:hypothetical protein